MQSPFTRRRFLRVSLLSGAALSGALLLSRLGRRDGIDGPDGRGAGLRCLSAREYQVLQAAARRLLDGATPEVGPGQGTIDVARWADGYLHGLDPGLAGDVKGLLQILERSPVAALRLTPFSALGPAEQEAVLRDWQNSHLALRRQGFQALKSLCALAYYQDARSFASIGYSGPLVPEQR